MWVDLSGMPADVYLWGLDVEVEVHLDESHLAFLGVEAIGEPDTRELRITAGTFNGQGASDSART